MDKPFAITLDPGSSLANHTGSWRTMRPVYLDRLPPCNNACPAGEDIQGWLYLAEGGEYRRAWEALVANNPMPAIMGPGLLPAFLGLTVALPVIGHASWHAYRDLVKEV